MGTSPVVPKRSKAKHKKLPINYVRWARRSHWLVMPIYVFAILIPVYYETQVEIPSFGQLQQVRGEFIYKHVGMTGHVVQLTTPLGEAYFTCRKSLFGNSQDCLNDSSHGKNLKGRQATVWWFEQCIYPYITQRRLVRLEVDGKEEVTELQTISITRRAVSQAPYWALAALILFILIVVFVEFNVLRRIEKNEPEHC